MPDEIAAVHDYWFGELQPNGLAAPDRHALWFTRSEDTDRTIRERFGALVERAAEGRLDHWAETNEGLVALIVLLDQFSRNIYRGTARAFEADPRALAISLQAIESERHRDMPLVHRVFLYLPLEHSEDLTVQERSVALFGEIAAQSGEPLVSDFARYAAAHRDVIARFGRFPHRNTILGRPSTTGEVEHLQRHGGF